MKYDSRYNPQRLFEENKELAYSYVYKSKIKIPGYELEDLFQTALLGLWKACKTYNPKKSRFSTYATNCIKNELFVARRKVISKTRISNLESLDRLVEDTDPNDKFTPYVDSFENAVIEAVDTNMAGLSNEEKAILSLKAYMSENEIAKMYESSWKIKKLKKKLRQMKDEGPFEEEFD